LPRVGAGSPFNKADEAAPILLTKVHLAEHYKLIQRELQARMTRRYERLMIMAPIRLREKHLRNDGSP